MQTFRGSAAQVYAGIIAAAAVTGCVSSRLSSQPPPGVQLAGNWKIDVARSDDLGKAIAQLRLQQAKARDRMRGESSGDYGRQGGAGPNQGLPGPELGVGPMPTSSPVDELMSSVPRGDYLRIVVSSDAFTVASGDSSEQYTPGVESDISAEQGDAQQISGWKGPGYVIDTKPQWGPEIIQSYGMTKDGRLAMTVRLTGRDTHLTFTRVYDRTTGVAPLAPPTNN